MEEYYIEIRNDDTHKYLKSARFIALPRVGEFINIRGYDNLKVLRIEHLELDGSNDDEITIVLWVI